ncbi:MAG: hypothetical protein ACR2RE_13015 [Geminicoccaceae bacterium]
MRTLCLALILVLGGCTAAVERGVKVGARVEGRIVQNLNVRESMQAEYLALVVEWCEILALDARNKRSEYFDSFDVRAAMIEMIEGDVEGARAALKTETLTLDQVQSAYDRAKACYQKQPSIVGVKQYREELRGAFD